MQIQDIVDTENGLKAVNLGDIDADAMFRLKRKGFSDKRLSVLLAESETEVRRHRRGLGIRPVYKRVDTCAAEFASATAYMYSSYEQECEAAPSDRDKILVLGGGRTVLARVLSLTIAVCMRRWQCARMGTRPSWSIVIPRPSLPTTTPPTVCTSSPLPWKTYWKIVDLEKPKGVIVQFGGQTPLKLARALEAEGVPIIVLRRMRLTRRRTASASSR